MSRGGDDDADGEPAPPRPCQRYHYQPNADKRRQKPKQLKTRSLVKRAGTHGQKSFRGANWRLHQVVTRIAVEHESVDEREYDARDAVANDQVERPCSAPRLNRPQERKV